MNKVINLQDKIQSINNKRKELDMQRKKVLNKKTTFHFSYYELFVLMMELSDYILACDDLARDIVENEEDNDYLEIYSYDALHTTKLVKKLYKRYLNNNCFSDSKIQLTLSDMEICIEALEMTCNPFVSIDSNNDAFTFKDEYEKLDKYYKTTFYLYALFRTEKKSILDNIERLEKQSFNKKELKKYEEFQQVRNSLGLVEYDKTEDMLYDEYKSHYLKEFRSKIQFIYESTSYIGNHVLWSTYFVKGNSTFNKFMSKYKYRVDSDYFSYLEEWELEDEKEINPDVNYFPPGWRFLANVPSEDKYEKEVYESDNYEFCMEYEDFILLKLQNEIKNSEEMQNFEFEIIDYDKKEETYNHFDMLNERLLDKFEIIVEAYCGAGNIIYPSGKIGYEFDRIIALCYEE